MDYHLSIETLVLKLQPLSSDVMEKCEVIIQLHYPPGTRCSKRNIFFYYIYLHKQSSISLESTLPPLLQYVATMGEGSAFLRCSIYFILFHQVAAMNSLAHKSVFIICFCSSNNHGNKYPGIGSFKASLLFNMAENKCII